jgi:hypothetical protein
VVAVQPLLLRVQVASVVAVLVQIHRLSQLQAQPIVAVVVVVAEAMLLVVAVVLV